MMLNKKVLNMNEYVIKNLKKFHRLKEISYLDSEEYAHFIDELSNATSKEELLQIIALNVSTIVKNTKLDFDYGVPMIWDNWGLDEDWYTLHPGAFEDKMGFGSRESIFTIHRENIFFLLNYTLLYISYYKYSDKTEDLNSQSDNVWNQFQKDLVMDCTVSILTEIMGELYLKFMPPEKLRELQIRFKSNYPEDEGRSNNEKISMNIDSIIASNLLPLALQLAAEYNTSTPPPPQELRIYFEHTGDDGYVNILRFIPDPTSRDINLQTAKNTASIESVGDSILFADHLSVPQTYESLQTKLRTFEFARLNLKELVKKLESVIVDHKSLPMNKEQRKDFIIRAFEEKLLEENKSRHCERVKH